MPITRNTVGIFFILDYAPEDILGRVQCSLLLGSAMQSVQPSADPRATDARFELTIALFGVSVLNQNRHLAFIPENIH